MTKSAKLQMLQDHIARVLITLEDDLHDMGLTTVTGMTLIARDPQNPEMVVVVSNDDIPMACQMALEQEQKHLVREGGTT